MSASGANRKSLDMGPLLTIDANDPNVWSGRALQEDFLESVDVRSCINVSGL